MIELRLVAVVEEIDTDVCATHLVPSFGHCLRSHVKTCGAIPGGRFDIPLAAPPAATAKDSAIFHGQAGKEMLFAESTHLYAIECLLVTTRYRESSPILPAITRSYILQIVALAMNYDGHAVRGFA